jgi:L-lactate dehydrogenase complex protein LldG
VIARAEILAAIRAADVPPAPAPVPMTGPADTTDLHGEFFRALESVGGAGAICQPTQAFEEVVAALLGPGRHAVVPIPGRFAVAENGAVYVDADDLANRADVVLATEMVLVVPTNAIVATMHDAMRLIPAKSRCGWFLSGPSKTADIEQALVIGAQGARTLLVVFRD